MNKAQIENGIVVNVIVVDPYNIPFWCNNWPTITVGGNGWSWDGKLFTAPTAVPPTQEELDAIAAQALAYARSRMVASAFQTREALDLVGKLDAVEAAILQADATTKRAWTYATEFRRGSPTIATMATALSLTDEDVDALFTLAMSIEV